MAAKMTRKVRDAAVGKDGLTAGQRHTLNMVKCRAYGHQWEDRGWLAMITASIRLWSQRFDCLRCTMARYDHRTQTLLALDSRKYVKPDGYPGRLPQRDAIAILCADTPAACYELASHSPFVQAA
jgi:hypothetical protein